MIKWDRKKYHRILRGRRWFLLRRQVRQSYSSAEHLRMIYVKMQSADKPPPVSLGAGILWFALW